MAPYHILGRDKAGRTVIEVPFGKWNVRGIVSTLGETEFFHYTNQYFERIMANIQSSQELDPNDDEKVMIRSQAVFLFDLEGYSYSQLASVKSLQSTLDCVTKYERYYPEILAFAILINAPKIFSLLYAMVKPLLPPNTVTKIKIFGSDKESWTPVIKNLIDNDQIGTNYGGTAVRPFPE
jgi:hypothetical protein